MLGRSSAAGFAATAVAVVALAGCSSDDVKTQWEQRTALPACGTVTLQSGASLQQGDGEQLACLDAAFKAGRGAELTVTQLTQEGDPVTEYYRVTADGTTEVYVDSTRDPNSDNTWSFDSCGKPRTALDVC